MVDKVVPQDGPARGRCATCKRLTWDPADIRHACGRVLNTRRDRCDGVIEPIAPDRRRPDRS